MNKLTRFFAWTGFVLIVLPANAFFDGDVFNIRYLFPDTDTVFLSEEGITIGAGPRSPLSRRSYMLVEL